jgi:tungstate transport system permease protein
MELIWQGALHAIALILRADPEVMAIMWLSLKVSGVATLLSLLLGVPLGATLGLTRFPSRGLVLSLVNTGMALPPVVVGLFVSIFLWRSGPLGFLELLYTPLAVVIAQFILAFPIVTGLTVTALQQLDPRLRAQLLALGASRAQVVWQLLWEARLAMLAAVMAAFGSVISEIGASMMVGGNILGYTRVLTTATVLETAKGNFDVAIALSVILLVVTFVINWGLTAMQQRGTGR